MSRKVAAAIGLLVLILQMGALAVPLLATDATACCNGAMCTMPHKRQAPANSRCSHQGAAVQCNCSLQSRGQPEDRAVGVHSYLLPEPLEAVQQAKVVFHSPLVVLFIPVSVVETPSPPPRAVPS